MEKTVSKINTDIARAIAKDCPKLKLMLYNIAEPILIRDKDAERTAPAIVCPDGECFDVFGSTDMYDVTMYHRLQNRSYSESSKSYGSGTAYNVLTDMSVVAYGKRSVVTPYEIERAVCRALMKSHTIVSSDFNAINVFASEYTGVPFVLNPDYFLFKSNYRITGTVDSLCQK